MARVNVGSSVSTHVLLTLIIDLNISFPCSLIDFLVLESCAKYNHNSSKIDNSQPFPLWLLNFAGACPDGHRVSNKKFALLYMALIRNVTRTYYTILIAVIQALNLTKIPTSRVMVSSQLRWLPHLAQIYK